ncbi:MAG TPA: FAD-binding oxidoreductase [Candidatus Binataceae bacterium]
MDKSRRRWGETPWRRTTELVPSAGMPSGPPPEVAIIGGGLTGASTAYHLARRGIRATVFEAVRIGDGASGRTGGLVLEGTAAGILDEVDSCVPGLEALVAEERIDCDLSLPGCWEIEHQSSGNERKLPWNDSGQSIFIVKTVKGGTVEPAALVSGIARAAVSRGAIVLEARSVQKITVEPQLAIESDGETIHPGFIVLALNAWTGPFLTNSSGIRSSLTFACATEPLPPSTLEAIGLAENIPFYTTDYPYLWGRTIADGRVIFGSQLVFGSPAELEELDVSAGQPGAALEALEQRVRQLHPRLQQVSFSASWAGPIAFRENAIPLITHHPSSSRIMVAGAYAGHGVALSVRMGQLLARSIAAGTPLPAWGSFTR